MYIQMSKIFLQQNPSNKAGNHTEDAAGYVNIVKFIILSIYSHIIYRERDMNKIEIITRYLIIHQNILQYDHGFFKLH